MDYQNRVNLISSKLQEHDEKYMNEVLNTMKKRYGKHLPAYFNLRGDYCDSESNEESCDRKGWNPQTYTAPKCKWNIGEKKCRYDHSSISDVAREYVDEKVWEEDQPDRLALFQRQEADYENKMGRSSERDDFERNFFNELDASDDSSFRRWWPMVNWQHVAPENTCRRQVSEGHCRDTGRCQWTGYELGGRGCILHPVQRQHALADWEAYKKGNWQARKSKVSELSLPRGSY